MASDEKGELEHCDREVGLGPDSGTPEYVPGTAEERALLRKIDLRMLPILWLMYVFNYLDRTNIGVSQWNVSTMTGHKTKS